MTLAQNKNAVKSISEMLLKSREIYVDYTTFKQPDRTLDEMKKIVEIYQLR